MAMNARWKRVPDCAAERAGALHTRLRTVSRMDGTSTNSGRAEARTSQDAARERSRHARWA